MRNNRPGDALTALRTARARELYETTRESLEAYYDRQAAAERTRASVTATWLLILRCMTLGAIVASVIVLGSAIRRIGHAISAGNAARRQVEQLFAMGDMLQSAVDMDDSNAVLRATALRLMPEVRGALYVSTIRAIAWTLPRVGAPCPPIVAIIWPHPPAGP